MNMSMMEIKKEIPLEIPMFSLFQDILKPSMLWLQDTGILIKLRDDELRAPNPIPLPKVKLNKSLGMSQLAMVFLLAAAGIVSSITVFIVEVLKGQKGIAKGSKPRQVGWGTLPPQDVSVRKDTAQGQNNFLPG